jgi:hypothetical protein
MSKQALTRDDIVKAIRHNASRNHEVNLYALHDQLCGRNGADGAYFDRVVEQMVSDGEIRHTRTGFASAA